MVPIQPRTGLYIFIINKARGCTGLLEHYGEPGSASQHVHNKLAQRDSVHMRKAMRADPSDTSGVHILATLCRFDHKHAPRSKMGPFIPCERRRVIMEI